MTPIYLVANHTFCIDPVKCIYFLLITTFMLFCSQHYGSILWQTLGKNPILVGYVVLGIGFGAMAHSKQLILVGYKVLVFIRFCINPKSCACYFVVLYFLTCLIYALMLQFIFVHCEYFVNDVMKLSLLIHIHCFGNKNKSFLAF